MPTANEPVMKSLRELRQSAGLTQGKLAEMAGIARTTVVFLENGRYPSARTSTLKSLADALGVAVSVLLDGGKRLPAAAKNAKRAQR